MQTLQISKKNKQRNRKNSRCSEGIYRQSYYCCEYDAIYTDKSEKHIIARMSEICAISSLQVDSITL